MVTIVGKLDGHDIVPLAEKDFEQISGTPGIGDVWMRYGKVYAETSLGPIDVTRRYCDLVGWSLPEQPILREDYYE